MFNILNLLQLEKRQIGLIICIRYLNNDKVKLLSLSNHTFLNYNSIEVYKYISIFYLTNKILISFIAALMCIL